MLVLVNTCNYYGLMEWRKSATSRRGVIRTDMKVSLCGYFYLQFNLYMRRIFQFRDYAQSNTASRSSYLAQHLSMCCGLLVSFFFLASSSLKRFIRISQANFQTREKHENFEVMYIVSMCLLVHLPVHLSVQSLNARTIETNATNFAR